MGDERDAAGWSRGFATRGADALTVYDQILVPSMFGPWAEHLLDCVDVATGDRVLDVACGPGTVARRAAPRVGPSGRVLGCDLSPGMLELARAASPAHGAQVDYVESPASPLAASDDSFDVAVCQQGVQFFPDRTAALREMRRALRPGGRLGIAVWADIERCPPFAALAAALHDSFGADAAERYRGGPWGFGSADALGDVVDDAGFTRTEVTTVERPVRFDGGVEALLATLASSPLAPEIPAADADAVEHLERSAHEHLAPLVRDGAVATTMTANLAVASA